jgi:hypothetical protein
MGAALYRFLGILGGTALNLVPIVRVVAFFKTVVLRQPVPDLGGVFGGLICVVLGLVLFVQGLEMGLFRHWRDDGSGDGGQRQLAHIVAVRLLAGIWCDNRLTALDCGCG